MFRCRRRQFDDTVLALLENTTITSYTFDNGVEHRLSHSETVRNVLHETNIGGVQQYGR